MIITSIIYDKIQFTTIPKGAQNMRFPVFFTFMIFLVLFLAYKRSRQTKNQSELNEAFLERERRANSTRKKDISNLDYLPFSADALPLSQYSDDKLASLETTLKNLSGKRIINLSMYSNTDLKLMYGPANLNDLSEYDENYHVLSDTLLAYALRELELDRKTAAAAVLEYAAKLRIDSSRIYLTLAKLYQKQHTPEKNSQLIETLSSMDEDFAGPVIQKIHKLSDPTVLPEDSVC